MDNIYQIKMFKSCFYILIVCLCCSNIINCNELINNKLIIKNVDRSIDLSTQLVKILSTVTFENTGNGAIKNVIWAPDNGSSGRLSFISAKDASKRELELRETKIEAHEGAFYSVEFIKPIEQTKFKVIFEEIYAGAQVPYPAAISQKEKQLVRWFGNHYVFSPYSVTRQNTKVHVRTKSIESYTKLKPFTLAEGLLTYGPYDNIKPFSTDELMVHYENNSPFLAVTQLKRHIEVSHWGNIAIEEYVSLLHTGATLKGSFSRYDYMKDNNGFNSIKSFKTVLPASATSPYYRDNNGNISTSNMVVKKDSVELDLRPRYPLFGGWKTSYTLGYSVPSYQYLFHQGDSYVLKIRFLDHIFDDMQVDKMETSIVLPVGATDIELKTPYPVARLTDSILYKYLDTKGRLIVRFSKSNLVENHIQDIELKYHWSRALMLHEPILLSIVLFALFLIIIVYMRLDFSIHPDNKKQQ